MRIDFALVPIEFEITTRRRTRPFRFGVRALMIAVAVVAVVVYLSLPLSAAEQRRMSIFEQLGNNEPKVNLTSAQVIGQIGPPSSIGTRTPKTCTRYTWVAHFDRPASHKEFELNLQIDPDTDLVAAWGLNKKEYEGLDLILFRLAQLIGRVSL